ncbi:MAG: hypothetical protein OEZ34_00430 [Spirochaetia bacterium]|nr:hypothetical protein [Spirochaetia bacterium]
MKYRYFISVPAAAVFFLSVFQAAAAQPADFLNPWINDEAKRMFGYRNTVSKSIAGRNESEILDSFGLKFKIDRKGRLSFDPLDDNWKIRTFKRSNILFHMAEAESFYQKGLYEEALSIYKSASYLFLLGDLKEHEREAAVKAKHAINRFSNDHVFYEDINRKITFIAVFDDLSGRTHVFSAKSSLHVVLPGSWSFRIPEQKFPDRYEAVYLRQAEHELTVAWEKPKGIHSIGNPLDNYVYLWDYRQHLDERIKRMNRFERKLIQTEACGRKKILSEKLLCRAYEAAFNNLPFYQLFFLNEKDGVYMIYKNPDPVSAKNVVRFIAKNIKL